MSDSEKFELGCTHFNEGEYFEAHEVWEDLWMEAQGPRRSYLQGLIQVAVALHHAGNENWAGTRKLSASALGHLAKGEAEAHEVDVEVLRERVVEFDVEVQRRVAGESADLPFFRLPRK